VFGAACIVGRTSDFADDRTLDHCKNIVIGTVTVSQRPLICRAKLPGALVRLRRAARRRG
jgi:hypothetical protein